MSNTATRLITLLMLLQSQPNQKASDLADNLGVSGRSLHRYITMLDEMGIPVYSERGPYGGFSLVRGYKMPPLVLTPEEAVAVYLGTSLVREMWGKLYQAAAQGALAKLDNVLPEEQRHEIAGARRTLVTTGMRRVHLHTLTPVLEKLRRAIREQRRVLMVHRKQSDPDAQAREAEPHALVHRAGWWYVVGHCRLRDAMRSFRLDRIVALTLLDKTYQPPADFNIQEFLAQGFESETKVQIRLRFASHAAPVVRDSGVAWDAVEDQADGAVIVTLTMPDLQWAASLALGFGQIVTVLEPEELRQTVREWAGAIAAQYAPVEKIIAAIPEAKMFELPEFATLAKQFNETLKGKVIREGRLGNTPHKFVWYNRKPDEFARLTKGKKVGKAWAKGKWLFAPLEPGYVLVFGECGGKVLYHPAGTEPPSKYHLCIVFEDGSALSATTQMWGAMELFEKGKERNRQYIKDMRTTPVEPGFTFEYFGALIDEVSKIEMKSAKGLLTQDQLIPGLGNAIAQDILFRARLSPKHPIDELTKSQRRQLYNAISKTVRQIIEKGGRYDEYDLYGNPGRYVRLMDKNALERPCPECGRQIQKIAYLGGACYFCPNCQK